VRNALVNNGTTGKITGPGSGSPNVLLYTGFIGGDPGCIQPIGNPGFESDGAPWTATANVIGTWGEYPARTGSRNAWLNGGGRVQTDTLQQSVPVPAGCTSLRFWLRITTAEYENVVYDRLNVTIDGTTVATYTNLDRNTGYAEKVIGIGQYAGQTVTLRFTGVEDQSLQTTSEAMRCAPCVEPTPRLPHALIGRVEPAPLEAVAAGRYRVVVEPHLQHVLADRRGERAVVVVGRRRGVAQELVLQHHGLALCQHPVKDDLGDEQARVPVRPDPTHAAVAYRGDGGDGGRIVGSEDADGTRDATAAPRAGGCASTARPATTTCSF
jgi:hypothetical protein